MRRAMRAPLVALVAALCCAGVSAVEAAPGSPIGALGPEDHRVPVEPDRFPWSSIGRINRAGSGFCTASLIGPRQVLTAAHCLYDPRTKRWVRPDEIHFLAGYARGDFTAHRDGAEFTVAPDGSQVGYFDGNSVDHLQANTPDAFWLVLHQQNII